MATVIQLDDDIWFPGDNAPDWLKNHIKFIKQQYAQAQTSVARVSQNVSRRLDGYSQSMQNAEKIGDIRQEHAQNYFNTSAEFKNHLKKARSEVREKIDQNHLGVTAQFQAERDTLHWWNPLHAPKLLGLAARSVAHSVKYNFEKRFHPFQTHRHKKSYRDQLALLSQDHLNKETAMRAVQKAHRRSAWHNLFHG